jgi:S1-C subfamily serine protease
MGFRAAVLIAGLLLNLQTQSQPLAVLRIKVTIADADGRVRPVPRHALLISENPSTAAPRRVVTALDGTAEVRLRPANYTVESDEPLIFQGKAYQWAETLDVAAGAVATLEMTSANARVEAAAAVAAAAAGSSPAAGNASALLLDWQTSVVSIWSPTRLGAGFLIDARGLIATNQRLVGPARSLEVQLSPTEKVAARVLASDPDKNVAILWIDPKAVASARPMKLAGTVPAAADKEKIFAITTTIHDGKHLTSGTVSRVTSLAVLSDIRIDDDTLGAPLFNAAGEVVAISTPEDETSGASAAATRAVRIDAARSVIAAAEKKMQTTEAPSGTLLPVEPQRPLDVDVLKEAAKRRTGNLAPYMVKGEDFEVSLITPVLAYGARHPPERTTGRERGRSAPDPAQMQAALRALADFGNWEDYVRDDPPVLLIRATPKLVESLWKTIARGAAQTQGISIPAMKSIKAGFSSMRVSCGDAEVTPIHPFKIERRVSANGFVYEGLYVFDPAAIGPHCGTVKLTLFSDKAPAKGDVRVVDPKIVQQIWDDFAPYRAGA